MMKMMAMNMIIMNMRVPSHLVLALVSITSHVIITVILNEHISISLHHCLGKIYPTSLVAYAVLEGCVVLCV